MTGLDHFRVNFLVQRSTAGLQGYESVRKCFSSKGKSDIERFGASSSSRVMTSALGAGPGYRLRGL